MPGQVTQYGAQALINFFGGNAVPYIGSSAPSWVPGLYWINTSSSPTVYTWNGTTWVSGAGSLYVALLTGNPATSGSSGGLALNISDLQEDTTTGYSRQSVTFTDASATVPATASNSNTITFGPYTANQSAPVQWAALVTASSGTTGLLRYTWTLSSPQQVQVSQVITIPPGDLVLSEG